MPIIYHINWKGIDIVINYKPKTFDAYERNYGTPLSHIEIKSDQPLPITETGYKSHFIANKILLEYGGPLELVKALLEQEAKKPVWKAYEVSSRQLTLF